MVARLSEIAFTGVWILSPRPCSVEHMFDTEILPAKTDLLGTDSDNDHALPADLESIPPGLLLAVILSSVDGDRLSGFDRVRLLKADARMVAHFQARLYADIQSVSESVPALDYPEDPMHLTRRSADIHVDLASLLCERLPRVWKAHRSVESSSAETDHLGRPGCCPGTV